LVDKKTQLIAHRDPKLLAGKQLINLSKYPPVKTLLAGKSGRLYYSQVRRYGFGTGNRPEIMCDDGGDISRESELGKGSNFPVELPTIADEKAAS
jgi:hypothetical protein